MFVVPDTMPVSVLRCATCLSVNGTTRMSRSSKLCEHNSYLLVSPVPASRARILPIRMLLAPTRKQVHRSAQHEPVEYCSHAPCVPTLPVTRQCCSFVEQLHSRGVFWRIRGGPPGGAAGGARRRWTRRLVAARR